MQGYAYVKVGISLGRRLVKTEILFYKRTSQRLECLYLFSTRHNGSKNLLSRAKYEMRACSSNSVEKRKNSRRRPRFVNYAEGGNFTLLFYRGRQRNVKEL